MTLEFATFVLVAAQLGLIAIQAILVYGFAVVVLRGNRPHEYKGSLPKTTVILCLRGEDPFLEDCITAILDQDYDDYHLSIVIDSKEDPAWNSAEQIVSQSGAVNVTIQSLEQRQDTCSLKCSSVVQAIKALDDSVEVIALLDADTVPHRTWLRELVSPLRDKQIAAATGNRWYMPESVNSSTLVRYVWNAAAIVQMYWYKIAWGGTLAVKTEVFRKTDLLDRWSNAFCEDTMVYRALRQSKQRLVFVPSLLMVNRENCDLPGFYRWVRRQLLTARLYHPRWLMVLAHGISTTVVPVLTIAALVVAVVMNRGDLTAWLVGSLAANWVTNLVMVGSLEWSVRRAVSKRNEATAWMRFGGFLKFVLALPLTQLVYAAALCSSLFLRIVDWRGVSYHVKGPWDIRLMQYAPFVEPEQSEQQHSL